VPGTARGTVRGKVCGTLSLGLVFGLVLTGCASAHDDGRKEPPAQVPNIRDINTFTLPLDAYQQSPADRQAVRLATTTLVTRCLHGLGVKADILDPRPTPFQQNARRYGITDEARAKTYGYSAPEISKRSPRPDLPKPVQEVAFGRTKQVHGKKVPEGGCTADAERRLDSGAPARPARMIAGQLGVVTLERASKDSRVKAAFGKWSACMRTAGHPYSTPTQIMRDKRFVDGREHRVTKLEIDTALADVRCKKSANLINVWAGVETAYQRLAVAQNKAALSVEQRLLATRRANAAKVNEER